MVVTKCEIAVSDLGLSRLVRHINFTGFKCSELKFTNNSMQFGTHLQSVRACWDVIPAVLKAVQTVTKKNPNKLVLPL